jgi:hypothetical protein
MMKPLLRSRPMSRLAYSALALCAGCGPPPSDYPPGYIDACFGGAQQQARNWVCSESRLRLSTVGDESEWSSFAQIVAAAGRERGLTVIHTDLFDSTQGRAVEVSVCSAEGLYVSFNAHSHELGRPNPKASTLIVELRAYRNSFDWQPIADALIAEIDKSWPRKVDKQWPQPIGSKRALPDSVHSCEET